MWIPTPGAQTRSVIEKIRGAVGKRSCVIIVSASWRESGESRPGVRIAFIKGPDDIGFEPAQRNLEERVTAGAPRK